MSSLRRFGSVIAAFGLLGALAVPTPASASATLCTDATAIPLTHNIDIHYTTYVSVDTSDSEVTSGVYTNTKQTGYYVRWGALVSYDNEGTSDRIGWLEYLDNGGPIDLQGNIVTTYHC